MVHLPRPARPHGYIALMSKGVAVVLVLAVVGIGGYWMKGEKDKNDARGETCAMLSLAMTAGVRGDQATSSKAIQSAVDAAGRLPTDDPFRAEVDGWGTQTSGTQVAAFMARRCP